MGTKKISRSGFLKYRRLRAGADGSAKKTVYCTTDNLQKSEQNLELMISSCLPSDMSSEFYTVEIANETFLKNDAEILSGIVHGIDLSGYARKGDVDQINKQLEQVGGVGSLATMNYVVNTYMSNSVAKSTFVSISSELLSSFATKQEISSIDNGLCADNVYDKGEIDTILRDYVKTEEINNFIPNGGGSSSSPDAVTMATMTSVLLDYYQKVDIDKKLSSYATTGYVDDAILNSHDGYATVEWVNRDFVSKKDLSIDTLVRRDELSNICRDINVDDFLTREDLSSGILSAYVRKDEIDKYLPGESTGDGNSQNVNLDNYITKTEAAQAFVSKAYVDSQVQSVAFVQSDVEERITDNVRQQLLSCIQVVDSGWDPNESVPGVLYFVKY